MTELTGSTDLMAASVAQATADWQSELVGELPTLHSPSDQKRPRERSFESTILVGQIGESLETRLAKSKSPAASRTWIRRKRTSSAALTWASAPTRTSTRSPGICRTNGRASDSPC